MVRLRAAGVPAGPVRSIAQAVASPEMQARAVIGEAPHRKYGTVPNLRLPMTMTGRHSPPRAAHRPGRAHRGGTRRRPALRAERVADSRGGGGSVAAGRLIVAESDEAAVRHPYRRDCCNGPVPWCGMVLAGMGAEVIRIDRAEAGRPGHDEHRSSRLPTAASVDRR